MELIKKIKQAEAQAQEIIEQAHETAKKILAENKSKLKALAEKLIAQETLEGEDLEMVFTEIGLSRPKKRVRKTAIPIPVEPVAEGEKVPKPKKVPGVPRLVPEHTPAPSD